MEYRKGGHKRILPMLPGRTKYAIWNRANKLGISIKGLWSDDEVIDLEYLWQSGKTIAEIAGEMGRTQLGVYQKARELGLPGQPLPDDCELVESATHRTGYDRKTLKKILDWAGVERLRPPVPRGRYRKVRAGRKCRRVRSYAPRGHYANSTSIDEAIAAWQQTETVARVAKRIGVCGQTLRRWLVSAGYSRPGKKKSWRVTQEEVDRAVNR